MVEYLAHYLGQDGDGDAGIPGCIVSGPAASEGRGGP